MSQKLSDAVLVPTAQRTLDFVVCKDGMFAQTVQSVLSLCIEFM